MSIVVHMHAAGRLGSGVTNVAPSLPSRPPRATARGRITEFVRSHFAGAPKPAARALVHLCQEPLSCCAKVFQDFTLSAGQSGLVTVSDGHRDSEKEIGNVRKDVGEIQNV